MVASANDKLMDKENIKTGEGEWSIYTCFHLQKSIKEMINFL